MPGFVTVRRWALKHADREDELVAHVRDAIIPAYKEQAGCLDLELLRMSDTASYLAITHWDARASFEAWAGPAGQAWRDRHRGTLERWLELMAFQAEWDAEELVSG
jgi:heme-degrading monooxygenase HmoA